MAQQADVRHDFHVYCDNRHRSLNRCLDLRGGMDSVSRQVRCCEGESMDATVKEFLARRQASWHRSHIYFQELWNDYLSAGLANKHFVSELTSGSDPKFAQRVWEMRLARHLKACGHNITSQSEGEPDFRFEQDGVVVWVEAVSPECGGDLSRATPTNDMTSLQQQILLRWTTALDAKWKKGIEYRQKGVVKPEDAYVIAIDGSQLGRLPLAHGASRRPYIVEAVFAVGPLAFIFDTETGRLGGTTNTVRFETENRNKALVRTEAFLNPVYAGVSGVITCVPPMFSEAILPIQVAYNPLADIALKPGVFGPSAEEWTAELVGTDAEGQDWDLKRL